MKEKFREMSFHKKTWKQIHEIFQILDKYRKMSIILTLRQLYYQLVTGNIISNKEKEYKKLSGVVTNLRYSGLADWLAIEDRGRVPNVPSVWNDLNDFMKTVISAYSLDRWEGQTYYVELWTEKDALSSVIKPIAKKWQVPLCVNRGYSSASAMYLAAKRFLEHDHKKKVILYLGDHDASGLDMIRDIKDRMTEFKVDVEVIHMGITMEQIKKYNPPPNPAKQSDPRSKWYIEQFGGESWEVDALKPEILQRLINDAIIGFLDIDKYNAVCGREREEIKKVADFAESIA